MAHKKMLNTANHQGDANQTTPVRTALARKNMSNELGEDVEDGTPCVGEDVEDGEAERCWWDVEDREPCAGEGVEDGTPCAGGGL